MRINPLSLAAVGLIMLALGGCSSAPKQAEADVGDNRFVHAPSSGRKVATARLADRYWSQHFAGARRPVL